MATYNGERFLTQQLHSILQQDVLPNELVVSDDGSTDGTLLILRSFANHAPFNVTILTNSSRLGYRKNFLKAAMACKCDLILFCDQDDVWDTRKVGMMRAPFVNADTAMAYHHAWLIDDAGVRTGTLTRANKQNPWQSPDGMAMAFRRHLLCRSDLNSLSVDYYFPKENLAHDQWVTLLASAFGQIAVVDELLIGYRQHGGNVHGAGQSHSNFAQKLRDRIKDRSGAFDALAKTCEANTHIFQELSRNQGLTESWRQRACVAVKMFQELRLLYTFRSTVYNERLALTRFLAFCKLARLRAYTRTNYWTFGRGGALRDFLFGVLFAPVIKKLGAQKAYGDANCQRTPQ